MSEHESNLVLLFVAGLVVIFRIYCLIRRFWNLPLNHGPGFFFGVGVASGFYEGPGIQWLKRYRTLLVAQHLILLSAFAVPVALRRWNDLPLIAPIDVVTLFSMMGGFILWVRRTLGANLPRLSSIAIPLEARRLSDYISWPMEALVVALLASSWILLLKQGDIHVLWQSPVLITYVVMGLLPGKIILARNSVPLPSERTEEHHRWQEANRRYSLGVLDSLRWFLVAILAAYTVQHCLPAAKAMIGLRWNLLGAAIVLWLVMVGILIRGSGKLTAMGRDLRPIGSWSGPFGSAKLMLRGGMTWGILYCAGLAALFVFFWR